MYFTDRQDAGRLLAEMLIGYRDLNPVVLALPRGGVPVAKEIASALKAPLDVLVVRKIGAPFQSELAVGAICEEDAPVWNQQILARTGLSPDDLNSIVEAEVRKVKAQIKSFRGGQKLPDLEKKTVIVVDDGLATGATINAAVKYLKKKNVAQIVVAVPVAAADSARSLRKYVHEVLALGEHENFASVGQWYRDFSQVSDEEVKEILQKHRFSKINSREKASAEMSVDN